MLHSSVLTLGPHAGSVPLPDTTARVRMRVPPPQALEQAPKEDHAEKVHAEHVDARLHGTNSTNGTPAHAEVDRSDGGTDRRTRVLSKQGHDTSE